MGKLELTASPRVARALSRYLVALQFRLPRWEAGDDDSVAARDANWRREIEALTAAERAELEQVLGTFAMTLALSAATPTTGGSVPRA